MPLSEQRRAQLDGIVQQMVQNKETDPNIQFVVDDFKKKYENEASQNQTVPEPTQPVQSPSAPVNPPVPTKTIPMRVLDTVKQGYADNIERTKGFAKEALSIGSRLGSLGANIGGAISNGVDSLRGVQRPPTLPESPAAKALRLGVERPQAFTPNNDLQKQGAATENVAEFLVPNPFELAKLPKTASVGAKALNFGSRVLESGLEQGARSAVQKGTAKDIGTDAAVGAAIPVAGAALTLGGNVISKVVKTMSSKLSGVPVAAIEEAITNPYKVSKAIKQMSADPELGPQKVVKFAEDAFDDLLKDRSANYKAGLDKLEKETMVTKGGQWYVKKFDPELNQNLLVPVDFSLKGVKDTATKALKDFGASAKGNQIDLTDVPLPSSYKKDLEEVVNKIYDWKKLSPKGLDDLRENLDVFYRRSTLPSPADTKFNAILTRIKSNLSNYTRERVPQIGEMNDQFAKESEVIKLIKQELSLGKDKPGTVATKLINIFNPKSSKYLGLLDKIGPEKANQLRAEIAGSLMSRWTPEGLGSYLAASAGGGMSALAAMGKPQALLAAIPTAAMSSPRIVGATATSIGKVSKNIPKRALKPLSAIFKAGASKVTGLRGN